MGTENVLLFRAPERAAAGTLAQRCFRSLERLERLCSKFRSESDLSLVNQRAAFEPVCVEDDVFELLRLAKEAWELTGGAFDPTVAGLLAAWGLVDMEEARVPSAEEIAALRSHLGMDRVGLDAVKRAVSFDDPRLRLDLGAIAKGYAADRLAAEARAGGVEAGAVICGRSSIITWGTPPGESSWRLEVVDPLDPEGALLTLRAAPGAVSSSGAYGRRLRRGTKEYGHVLDPASGRPCQGLHGVTVWTETGVLGDVLATALFVGGAPALGSAGVLELCRRWSPRPRAEPRLSALFIEDDAAAWGGVRPRLLARGPAALELLEGAAGSGHFEVDPRLV